jgi:hypothetical protein
MNLLHVFIKPEATHDVLVNGKEIESGAHEDIGLLLERNVAEIRKKSADGVGSTQTLQNGDIFARCDFYSPRLDNEKRHNENEHGHKNRKNGRRHVIHAHDLEELGGMIEELEPLPFDIVILVLETGVQFDLIPEAHHIVIGFCVNCFGFASAI